MPNGNPKFHEEELPALEAFFSQIADVLNQFASRHNLMLDKYYHESPSWRFNFRHPKGGVASIDVMKESDDSVKIHGYWWLDDYDKFTRFLKTDESEEFNVDAVNLNDLLENKFKAILSWELGEWTRIATGYEEYWKPQGRKWIEKNVERYPKPKV
jgi:hypothetical protein